MGELYYCVTDLHKSHNQQNKHIVSIIVNVYIFVFGSDVIAKGKFSFSSLKISVKLSVVMCSIQDMDIT